MIDAGGPEHATPGDVPSMSTRDLLRAWLMGVTHELKAAAGMELRRRNAARRDAEGLQTSPAPRRSRSRWRTTRTWHDGRAAAAGDD